MLFTCPFGVSQAVPNLSHRIKKDKKDEKKKQQQPASERVKRSLNMKKTTAKLLRPKDNLRALESKEPTNPPSTNRCVLEVDSGMGTGGRIGKVSMLGNSSNFTNAKEVSKKNMLMPAPPKVHYPEHFLKNHALKK